MLAGLKTYYLFGNRFCSVEHTSNKDVPIIHACVLKKTKKEVDISATLSCGSIKVLAEKLSKNQSVFLIINNDYVLTKVIASEQVDDLKLVNQAFPNINTSEFYFEIVKQKDTQVVSVCRRSYIDDLIKEYSKHNLCVVNFSLGNSILSHVLGYLDDGIVFTSNTTVSVAENSITSIEQTDELPEVYYNINGLKVQRQYLLSFSGALNLLLNSYHSFVNYQNTILVIFNDYKQKRFFNQFLKFGLVFILGVLLVNFILFNSYFERVKSLNETSQINQAAKQQILEFNESVIKSKKMTDDMLKSSISKSSFYIDAISRSLPSSILLSQINYQPLDKKIKEGQLISQQINAIIVSGSSNDSKQYSIWIAHLEDLNWTTYIEVLDYSDFKSSSKFSIKIGLTDD